MSPPTPAWHAEAKRLHAEGMKIVEIGKACGKSETAVKVAINWRGAGDRRREADRAIREKNAALRPHYPGRSPPKVKPPRPIAGEPDPRVMAAARAFAAGQIDRSELMRRIVP